MEIRKVKIEEYWPLIVRGTEEFGQIAVAENPEFNRLAESVYGCLKESFILPGEEEHATEYGVSRWEKMLGLAVTPDMTLDDRKAAILTYLSIKLPYTWRVLKRMLTDLLGEDNFTLSFDNETPVLTVGLASTVEHLRGQVDDLIARVVPQNLEIKCDPLPIDYTRVEYLEVARQNSQYIPTAMVDVWGYKISFEVWGQDLLSIGGVTAYDTEGNSFNRNFLVYSQYDLPLMQFFISKQVNCYQEWGWAEKKRTFVYNDADYSVFRDGVQMKASSYDLGYVYQRCDNGFCLLGKKQWCKNLIESTLGVRQGVWKFWNKEGELKGHYIPALDPTGAPCMYDIVTREAFYNAGTGDFLYPTNEAPAMTTDLDEKFYAKLTEHGVRRLYKVPEGCTLTKDEYAAKHGFKELIEPPMPTEGYWTNVWKETDTQLICEWVETEPPMEVTEND